MWGADKPGCFLFFGTPFLGNGLAIGGPIETNIGTRMNFLEWHADDFFGDEGGCGAPIYRVAFLFFGTPFLGDGLVVGGPTNDHIPTNDC